jgi:anti-sigma B factor antagonist
MSRSWHLPPFETSVRVERDTVVVVIAGELDRATAPHARQVFAQAEAHAPAELLVDLAGLEHLDSSGVRVLHGAALRARAAGRRLAVVNCAPVPWRTIALLGLESLLEARAPPRRTRS